MLKRPVILNDKGEPVKLNRMEKAVARWLQVKVNELPLGFKVDITTLTTMIKRVSEQRFYTIPFAKYMPVLVGEGAFSTELTKYLSFDLGDDFEKGIIMTGADASRLASTDAGVTPSTVKIHNWAKGSSWSLFDLQQAQKSGNWDIVAAKERSRKRNFDLGIQRIAFLGLAGAGLPGLLNQSTSSFVTLNTSLITEKIKDMDADAISAFAGGLITAYQANAKYTVYPNRFVIPQDDWNGCATPSSADFPIIDKIDLLLKAFRKVTMNEDFQILPVAYATAGNSGSVLSHDRYALYNSDEDSIALNMPVGYTSTLANTLNGFTFQNVGYAQFSTVKVYREREIMYFDNENA